MDNGKVYMNHSLCHNCGKCVNTCFSDARILYGKEMSVDEVMAEILKERSYFVRSKGGVTFSGGEAALQADFVRECSRRCRLEYINTAIETAGAVRWETLWHGVEYIDEVLFDIKTLDVVDFGKLLDEPLQLVLNNLSRLCDKGKKVRIRCPIIPGFNDHLEFIQGVVKIALENGIEQIDLLPFHQMGSYKYKSLDKPYAYKEEKALEKDALIPFAEIIREKGIKCLIGG